jgi:hypothetical protein
MTILEALEEAHAKTTVQELKYADLREFQTFIKSFDFESYPVNIVVPIEENFDFLNNRLKTVIPIQGWILTRIESDTYNFRSIDIEKDYLQEMRKQAKKFVWSLINSDIVDPEVEEISGTIQPVYQFTQQHLFGVSYTVNLPIVSGVC